MHSVSTAAAPSVRLVFGVCARQVDRKNKNMKINYVKMMNKIDAEMDYQ